MKKAVSLFLAFAMLFCLCSCGNEYSKLTDDEIAAKVDSGELGTLYAHYSVQNGDSGDFYVQFDSSLKDYDYYSDKGTLVKFYGDTAVYDQDGNKVDCAQSLDQIHIPDPVKQKMECLEKRIK